MSRALREVPDVANIQSADLVLAVLVNSRDEDASSIDESPLGDAMPMQLS